MSVSAKDLQTALTRVSQIEGITVAFIGQFRVRISPEDAGWIQALHWNPVRCGKRRTQVYFTTSKQRDGQRVFPRLHRMIIAAKPREIVDHINGDTLDNRRRNLRITDVIGNAANRHKLNLANGRTYRYCKTRRKESIL